MQMRPEIRRKATVSIPVKYANDQLNMRVGNIVEGACVELWVNDDLKTVSAIERMQHIGC